MKKTVEDMDKFELARWLTLMEGVNIISDACADKKINFNNISLNPLDLQKYVEKTCDSTYMGMEKEQKYVQQQSNRLNNFAKQITPKHNMAVR